MATQEEQSEANEDKVTKNPKKWSRKKKIWTIVTIIVVTIIALVLIVNVATSALVKVSNALISDIQSKNASAGYSLLSSGAKGVVSADQFKQVVDQIGPILKGTPKMISKEVKGQTGSAASASVVYEIKGNDGATYRLTINLTKENGEWKVLNFDSTKK